jgi:hypothetical protein
MVAYAIRNFMVGCRKFIVARLTENIIGWVEDRAGAGKNCSRNDYHILKGTPALFGAGDKYRFYFVVARTTVRLIERPFPFRVPRLI